MSHTPTPWTHDKQSDCILDGDGRVIVSPYESDHDIETDTASAAFIVKAANAHEDLVAALRNLANEMRFMLERNPSKEGGLYRRRLNEAEEALAKAGAL